ncbi:MAG: GEVED domain-containing protein [Aequorivita sp.]
MKIKLPKYLYGSWLLTLTLLLAVSGSISAQSEMKTEAQMEAERMEQQSLKPVGTIAGQNSNRPMAFPDPYCEVDGFSWIEAITRVVFADVDNPSPVNSAISHEDFTSVVANVSAGETYSFAAEGDTGGNWTNHVTVWIDWNQDGIFDEATERYEIGTLQDSTGEDGKQAVSDIEVPADALAGQTRMRVMKNFSTPASDSCNAGSFGQAEDYTVEVGGGGGTAGETCDAPLVVTSLPYDDAGNTADYGNNYSNGDVPPVAPDAVTTGTGSPYYLSGDEVVYSYTPADNEVLNISTTNDDDWIGLWAFTGCPFTSTVGYHTSISGGTRLIEELPVTAGETYYFVISTWDPPQSTEYTIHIEKVGGGGSGDPCEQDFAFSLDDGVGDVKGLLFAEDFEIAAGETMSVEEVTFRMFNNIGEATTIAFYKDEAGLPGDLVNTFSNVAPDSQTLIGDNYGMDAYDLAFTLPSAVELDEGIYWVAIQVTEGTDGGTNFWVITDDGVHTPGHYTADGGVSWVQNSNSYDFSFKIEGECTSGGGTGGGFVCDDQFNLTNGIENGLFFGGTTNQKLAVDIIVGDDGFTAYGSNLNIFLDAGQTTGDLTFDFTIYDDQGGVPGSVVHSSAGTVKSTEFVGSNFGYDVHTFEVAFDDAADFDANRTYWMEVESNGVAWEATSSGIFGLGLAFFNDSTGGNWIVDGTEDLVYSLICEEGTGGGGTACEQVFYDENQPTGIGFSSGNIVANDITVAADESFTLQTMTFDVVNIDGEPSEFDLEIFEDNGSGGVGTTTGITHHFDSSNMTFVENGTFGGFTQYTVTLTLPEIELTADASEDARYWLAIASELSTTGDFTYWVSYDYVTNPDSYPSWQYTPADGWFEYVDAGNLTKEGIMTVSGICSSGGGDPDPCDAVDVPYVQDFETATPPDMPECTTVVNAGTGNNWKTSTSAIGDFTGTFLEYEYSSSAPANTWFFTQGINLEAGTDYEITYGYGSRAAAAFPENLKIAFGDDNDPSAMTNAIAEHVGILSGGSKIMNTVQFTATDSGVYYFGFNAFSDADQWFLYVDDIEIKEADTTGIEDQVNTVFTYYPNPTSGVITIAADMDVSSVSVFNILGQQVLTMNRPDNGQVNLSDLTTGTYIFRVMFENGSLETFKVLKQ